MLRLAVSSHVMLKDTSELALRRKGIFFNGLLEATDGVQPQRIAINVDHARLFIASCLLTRFQADAGEKQVETEESSTASLFPSCDMYRNSATPYRTCAGNLYRTKDGRYFHLHSDLNPDIVQGALDLPHDADGEYDAVDKIYQERVEQLTSVELDELANVKLRRSGTLAWSPNEYRSTEHGKANDHTTLWDVKQHPPSAQESTWWPDAPLTSPARPLAGLRVVDFSRIIAAPTATRQLAELGARVMRITGTYPEDVWKKVWDLHRRPTFRDYHPMQYLFPATICLLRQNASHLMSPDFVEDRKTSGMGCTINCVKPILQYPEDVVKPEFQVSARTNGVDQARWPSDRSNGGQSGVVMLQRTRDGTTPLDPAE